MKLEMLWRSLIEGKSGLKISECNLDVIILILEVIVEMVVKIEISKIEAVEGIEVEEAGSEEMEILERILIQEEGLIMTMGEEVVEMVEVVEVEMEIVEKEDQIEEDSDMEEVDNKELEVQ
jgi:hypothetical protein